MIKRTALQLLKWIHVCQNLSLRSLELIHSGSSAVIKRTALQFWKWTHVCQNLSLRSLEFIHSGRSRLTVFALGFSFEEIMFPCDLSLTFLVAPDNTSWNLYFLSICIVNYINVECMCNSQEIKRVGGWGTRRIYTGTWIDTVGIPSVLQRMRFFRQ